MEYTFIIKLFRDKNIDIIFYIFLVKFKKIDFSGRGHAFILWQRV
jgi:hypothetical protein